MTTRSLVLLAVSLSTCAFAQSAHWEGTIEMQQKVPFTADLTKNAKGEWIGSINIPAGGIPDAPLSAISVKDGTVKFSLVGIPHPPAFEGKLSADGAKLAGEATTDQGSVPFELTRAGEANIKLPPPSTPVSKEFAGDWEGSLQVPNGPKMRVAMKLNGATGKLISIDEGSAEFLIVSIAQKDKQLQFRTMRGKFSGSLNDAGTEVAGDYSTSGLVLPVVFKRPADVAKDVAK